MSDTSRRGRGRGRGVERRDNSPRPGHRIKGGVTVPTVCKDSAGNVAASIGNSPEENACVGQETCTGVLTTHSDAAEAEFKPAGIVSETKREVHQFGKRMSSCGGEEVYTFLLTNIGQVPLKSTSFDIPSSDLLKKFYCDHLLKKESRKVISMDLEPNGTSAIIKIKAHSSQGASIFEEIKDNLKLLDRAESVQMLYSESCTMTLKWSASVKSLASGIVLYAKNHYPSLVVSDNESMETTITGTAHDVLCLQHQYTNHLLKGRSVAYDPIVRPNSDVAVSKTEMCEDRSNIKEYTNFNPDVLALLKKLPAGNIPGVRYDIDRGCILIDTCSSEEEATCVSSIQAQYLQLTTSRKLKVEEIEIPEEVSDHEVQNMLSVLNDKYRQSVFLFQDKPRRVKIISNISRQFEQAKKCLQQDLKQRSAVGISKSVMSVSIANSRIVTLKQADIILEEVDAIVNAANGNLEHGAGVAGAINRASHGSVQILSTQYVQKFGPLCAGEIAVTQAGGALKCKHIIHAVGPTNSGHDNASYENLLTEVIKAVLQEAENLNVKSISLPAISSGIFGVDTQLVARCIIDSIIGYTFRKPYPILSEIRIVIIDLPTYGIFARYFVNHSKPAASSPSLHSSDGDVLHTPHSGVDKTSTLSAKGNLARLPKTHSVDKHPSNNLRSRGESLKAERCVICLDNFTNPISMKCEHIFCQECIHKALAASPYCPVCKTVLRDIIGTQPPNGSMKYKVLKQSLSGYEGFDTICITYEIPNGTQSQFHPNPGAKYHGTTRTAYLPGTKEGRKVLKLLQKAFSARLIFTVGQSRSSGADNVVVWNDIHHKTSLHGGPYGYPDETYLERVQQDLAAKGIIVDDNGS